MRYADCHAGRHAEERGSASVLGLAFTGLLVTAALIGVTWAAALVGQRRAAAGADLAALAGASAVQYGRPGCPSAATAARANQVRLTACEENRNVVTVEVATSVAAPFGSTWDVEARARAGPVGGAS